MKFSKRAKPRRVVYEAKLPEWDDKADPDADLYERAAEDIADHDWAKDIAKDAWLSEREKMRIEAEKKRKNEEARLLAIEQAKAYAEKMKAEEAAAKERAEQERLEAEEHKKETTHYGAW